MEKMRWGMPGPAHLSKYGKAVRPAFLTNIRNTSSGHWKRWLAATSVTVGKDKNAGGRCIVPVMGFAEPDKNTSKPVVNRWFGRADGQPFFSPGFGASGPATMAPSPSPTSRSTAYIRS
jgi:putative SOS response-associated peptidase YedK